jgi:hypothetical protein
MINYQGTLTDPNGTPVVNGNYNIEFKLYDVASGGAALWSEKWDTATSQIPVVGGDFNVMLGYQNPIPATFFADHPVSFLGIKVGTDSEMLPRQQITSVGYAFTAGNGVPKGGIIMWSGEVDQIPAGWALCDGVERTLPDGSKITPPNLKDRFVIGAGGGYAVAAAGGNSTINLSHTHIVGMDAAGNHSHGGHTTAMDQSADSKSTGSNSVPSKDHTHTINSDGSHVHNTWTGSQLSSTQSILPPYYALAFIIKL